MKHFNFILIFDQEQSELKGQDERLELAPWSHGNGKVRSNDNKHEVTRYLFNIDILSSYKKMISAVVTDEKNSTG